ncbi:MAG: TolC family protein [Rhodothermales bacterium]|nr:TolC family protein [Rhodothermales bacterium]
MAAPTLAQPAVSLTLDEAIARGQVQGPDARIARYDRDIAEWDYRATRAELLPALSLNGNAPGYLRSLTSLDLDDGSLRYIQQQRTFSSMSLALSQPIPLTGGSIRVSSGLSRITQTGGFGSNQWQAAPLLVSLDQPLFQYNALKWQRRLEPLRLEVAERAFTEDMATIAWEVANRYFDVFEAQQDIEIAVFNVAVNDTIFVLSQGRFDIGRIAENDLLQSELQLINARTARDNAEINHQRAVQELRIALRMEPGQTIELIPPMQLPEITTTPEEAVDQARQRQPAALQAELDELEAERLLEQARRNVFAIDVSASYGLNQSTTDLSRVYTDPLDRQQFNLGFQVPIFQWGQSRARIQSALAARRRAEEASDLQREELDQAVYFETLQLQLLRRQVEVAAQADTIATRRFEVARNRYLVGNIDITDLFNAQNEKDAANRSYIQTLRRFWSSYFTVQRLTMIDLSLKTPLSF